MAKKKASLFEEPAKPLTVDAVVAHARANPHRGGFAIHQDEPEMRWYFSLRDAVAKVAGRKHAYDEQLPSDVDALLTQASEEGLLAMSRAGFLEMADDELAKEIRALEKRLGAAKRGAPELDDDDAESEDVADEIDDADEPGEDGTGAPWPSESEQERDRAFWLGRELDAAREELQLRCAPGYNHAARMEARFTERYGAATSALRDVLVAKEMRLQQMDDDDVEDEAQIRVNGEVVEGVYHDAVDSMFGDDARGTNVDAKIDAIAAARIRGKDGYPTGCVVGVTPGSADRMPPLDDGVGRPYRFCPCCGHEREVGGSLFCEDCGEGRGCAQHLVAVLNGNEGVDRTCVYAPHEGVLFRASRFGRLPSGRIAWVYPTAGDTLIRRSAAKHFGTERVTVTITDSTMLIDEQLPPLPSIGDIDGVLQIAAVDRVVGSRERSLERWWYDEATSKGRHTRESGIAIIEHATATDVIRYASVPRTEPTILCRKDWDLDGIDELVAAIVGDRYGSAFGPRVAEVVEQQRRPAKEKKRAGEREDPLRYRVLDGDAWKIVQLVVDPLESFDEKALTEAVIARLEEDVAEGSPNDVALGIVRTFGAYGALRFARAVESMEPEEDRDLFEDETSRYDDGYTPADAVIAEAIQHAIICLDCGVLEHCHDGLPFPCGGATREDDGNDLSDAADNVDDAAQDGEVQLSLF